MLWSRHSHDGADWRDAELPESRRSPRPARACGRACRHPDRCGRHRVLKTYDPTPLALHGSVLTGVTRHGKFLDLDLDGLHLITTSPARAGCTPRLRCPRRHPPGKSPIALRVHLDDAPASTSPRPAPQEPGGLPRAGSRRGAGMPASDPTRWPSTPTVRGSDPGPPRPDQGRPDRPDRAGRDRQRLLRRDPAHRADVAVRARVTGSPTTTCAACTRGPGHPDRSRQAQRRAEGRHPEGREAVRAAGTRADRAAVPGVRHARPGGLVRRPGVAVLSRLPDRRKHLLTADCPSCSGEGGPRFTRGARSATVPCPPRTRAGVGIRSHHLTVPGAAP